MLPHINVLRRRKRRCRYTYTYKCIHKYTIPNTTPLQAPVDPYGTFEWAKATTTTAWASSGNWLSDYAIIELQKDTGLGWMSFGWHSGINGGWNMNMNG